MRTATIALLAVASIFPFAILIPSRAQNAITVPEAATYEEISSYPGLPHALLATRANASSDERAAVAALLNALGTAKENEVIPLLERFVSGNSSSPWVAAIKINLGYLAYQKGYFTKAVNAWREVWESLRKAESSDARLVAESAGVEYALMLARVGRMEELQAITNELGDRQFRGTNWSKLQSAREGLWAMTNRPDVSFRCGPYAVSNVATKINGRKDSGWLKSIKSPKQGFSLNEVGKMAEGQNLKMQAARRIPGASVIVPSVVHWKLDHYGALIEEKGGKYLLKDPTFKVEQWIDADVLDQESSGYFLVPSGPLPNGWTRVNASETANIRGKGHSGNSDDGETRDCSKKNGGKCGEKGMAGYQFHALLASLTVNDIPIWIDSAWGPDIGLEVRYNQRESNESGATSLTSFGPQWECPYVAYLTENGNGTITMYYGNGGKRVMSTASATWIDPVDNVNYERVAAGHYLRKFEDGSKQVYNHGIGIPGAMKVFLTQIVDPQGHAVTINYNSPTGAKVSSIVNAAGENLQFTYHASFPNLVTKIADPRGREANFHYTVIGVNPVLTKIVDPLGLASEFEYEVIPAIPPATQPTPGHLIALKTPYGKTSFRSGNPMTHRGLIRWIEAIDPHGDTERLEYNLDTDASGVHLTVPDNELPSAPFFSLKNVDMDDRNTFYWDKKAWAEAPGDCSKAKLIHWLPTATNIDFATGVIQSEKQPFESRIWYNYPGQRNWDGVLPDDPPDNPTADDAREQLGTLSLPSAIARQIEDEDGTTTVTQIVRREYNSYGNLTKIVDPKGRETSFEYVGGGNEIDVRFVKQKDPATQTWVTLQEIVYFDPPAHPHRPWKIYDAGRNVTTFTYNARHQVETITNAKDETCTIVYFETPGTSSYGRIKEILGPDLGKLVKYTYDGFGRPRTENDYVSVAESLGNNTITFDFDALDRLTRVTYPNQTFEEARYERMDLVGLVDKLGNLTSYTYNGLGQLIAVTDSLKQTTQYEWCRCGSLKRIVDGNGKSTRWKRDVQGRVISKIYADNEVDVFEYEPLSGRLSSVTDAEDRETTYRYAKDGRLRHVLYSDSTPDVEFAYDDFLGRPATMTDGIGTTAYTYFSVPTAPNTEQNGALQAATINGPLAGNVDLISFTYDPLNRPKTRTIGGTATVEWDFDPLGRLSTFTTPKGDFSYQYNDNSRQIGSVVFPTNSVSRFNFFHGASKDFRLQGTGLVAGGLNQGSSTFDYDARGDLTLWSRFNQDGGSEYILESDSVGQLKRAALQDFGPIFGSSNYSYAYDAGGNRISAEKDNVFTRWNVDEVNQLTSQSGGGMLRVAGAVGRGGQVTVESSAASGLKRPALLTGNSYEASVDVSPGNNTITVRATDVNSPPTTVTKSWSVNVSGGTSRNFGYDDCGNLLSDGVRQFTWDAANRMKTATVGGTEYSWEYDGMSRRIREKVNGVIQKQWVWCGYERCVELDASGVVKRRFYPDCEEQTEFGANAWVFYNRDHLGSVRELIDDNQAVVARYDYDLWGKRTANQITVNPRETDIGFTGHPLHDGTGLCLAPLRAYDADLAKWINRDPIGEKGGTNLYSYVANSPAVFFDPLGLELHFPSGFNPQPTYDYLEKSPTAKRYLDWARSKESGIIHVNIKDTINEKTNDCTVGMEPHINWNPNMELSFGSGVKPLSPALGFIHEVIHVYHMKKNLRSFLARKRDTTSQDQKWTNAEEKATIEKENQIARELGETERQTHKGGKFQRCK
jgi:RHS repeat-associated protein